MLLVINPLIKMSNPIVFIGRPTDSLFKQICYKYHITSQQPYLYNIKLAKIIEYLQNNGFVNKIEYFVIHITNIKYFIFSITTNRIIKKIEIKKYNGLKIPPSFLVYIFKSQIGLPFNYRKLSNSIQKIYKWYKNKGFAWTYIQLIKHKNPNVLCLQIFEGKIFKSSFICKCIPQSIISSNLLNKIEKVLEVELGISKGCILNVNKIEQGIIRVKNIKLINNCKYNIIHGSKGLYIEVEYTISINRCGHFYYKDLIIDFYQHYFRYYQDNLVINTSYYSKTTKNNIINLIKGKIFNIKQIVLYKYLGFKYYSSYFRNSYNTLVTNIELTNKIHQLNCYFFCPNIKFHKSFFSHILLNFYYKINLRDTIYPMYNTRIGFPPSNSQINFKHYLQSTGTSILYKHYINNQIYLTKDIIYENNQYQKKLLDIKKCYIKNCMNQQVSISKILHETIKQKLIFFHIQVKHNSLDSVSGLKSGKLFVLKSIFFTTVQSPTNSSLYQPSNLTWDFGIKYKQIFLLPNLFPYFTKKNAVILISNINWPVKLNKSREIFSYNYKYNTNMYIQYNSKQIICQYSGIKYLNTIEYHILTHRFNFLSNYIFCSCSNKLRSTYNNFLFNIGSGIELKIPIKTIPRIRFEYGIDRYKKKYYQFRILLSYRN
uniref:hypothetical protein n=1 Tax=Catenella fusiformis TaxID=3024791 RepID=UPI0027DA2F6A|nr:hypothetical protein REQ04_pgp121 [Catenella fusiformis]WCH57506.1 hypothetical protein [Catenella fusiformis]